MKKKRLSRIERRRMPEEMRCGLQRRREGLHTRKAADETRTILNKIKKKRLSFVSCSYACREIRQKKGALVLVQARSGIPGHFSKLVFEGTARITALRDNVNARVMN